MYFNASSQLFPPQPVPSSFQRNIAGTPLLFNDWVKAKVVSHNPLFENDSMLFNFDLVSQKLMATDKAYQYKISKKEFQSVTFYDGDLTLTFEHVPVINSRDLFHVVIKDIDKYSLYEYIHMSVRGNNYFVWDSFYVVFPFPNMQYSRFNIINKKLIKQSFSLSPDIQKVNAYYSEHSKDEPNAYFLRGLIDYLNQ